MAWLWKNNKKEQKEIKEQALQRSLTIEGILVCHIDDIIKSKEASGRIKDKESLPRLKAFRDWRLKHQEH